MANKGIKNSQKIKVISKLNSFFQDLKMYEEYMTLLKNLENEQSGYKREISEIDKQLSSWQDPNFFKMIAKGFKILKKRKELLERKEELKKEIKHLDEMIVDFGESIIVYSKRIEEYKAELKSLGIDPDEVVDLYKEYRTKYSKEELNDKEIIREIKKYLVEVRPKKLVQKDVSSKKEEMPSQNSKSYPKMSAVEKFNRRLALSEQSKKEDSNPEQNQPQ